MSNHARPGLIDDYQRKWNTLVIISILYEDYKMFSKDLNMKYPEPANIFGRKIRDLCPKIPPARQKTINGTKSVKVYLMPELQICRKEFERKTNREIDWDM